MLVFRPAQPQDAHALTDVAVRSEGHCGYDAAFMEAFRRIYAVTPEFIQQNATFLAEENGHLAGFYALVSGTENVELEYLYLDPEAMGKGLGRALWEHMKGQCRERGIEEIHLVCGPEPKAFYRKMGAVETGETDSLVIPGRKVARMVYRLEPRS